MCVSVCPRGGPVHVLTLAPFSGNFLIQFPPREIGPIPSGILRPQGLAWQERGTPNPSRHTAREKVDKVERVERRGQQNAGDKFG